MERDNYKAVLDHIMTELDWVVAEICQDLPLKAKKYNWPIFLWCEPVMHHNLQDMSMRLSFIRSLHEAAAFHDTTVVLHFKQVWSVDRVELFDWQRQYFTEAGKKCFWQSLENATRFADYKLMKNFGIDIPKIYQKPKLAAEMEERLLKFQARQSHKTSAQQRFNRLEIANIINGPQVNRTYHRRVVIQNNNNGAPLHTDGNQAITNRLEHDPQQHHNRNTNKENLQKKKSTFCRRLFKD